MKLEVNWKSKTLENLEKENWGEPQYDSHLVRRTHELRKVPLNEFSVEDLRINIGQNISLNYLIPLALEILTENLFADGDLFEGDLLQAVLKANSNYWYSNPKYWEQLNRLIEDRLEELESENIKYFDFQDLKLSS